jgi:hypothetical protein
LPRVPYCTWDERSKKFPTEAVWGVLRVRRLSVALAGGKAVDVRRTFLHKIIMWEIEIRRSEGCTSSNGDLIYTPWMGPSPSMELGFLVGFLSFINCLIE